MKHLSRYYGSAAGKKPVKEFIDNLNFKIQQRFFARESELLSAYGQNLAPPHVHHLDDGIYEFKVSFANLEYRFLFFRIKADLIFVHAFLKKTNKVEKQDIELARERRKDFLNRLERGLIKL
jgi:phage-related protein